MRACLSLFTTPLSLDEKISADRLLGHLPGVHHVEWGNRPMPHVNIVYENNRFIDRDQAQRVLGQACLMIQPAAAEA